MSQTVVVPPNTTHSIVVSKVGDAFEWDGQVPHNTVLPFPHHLMPTRLPNGFGDSAGRSWSNWVIGGIQHAISGLFMPVPLLRLTEAGAPVVQQAYYQRGNTSEEAVGDNVHLLEERAGGRNDSLMLPYVTVREIPGAPGTAMALTLAGWLAHIDASGHTFDAGGFRTPIDVMPRVGGKAKTMHGDFDRPMKGPNDFAFLPGDPHRIIVCDTFNDALVLVDGSVRPPTGRVVVQFPAGSSPYSCEFIGDTLYVALRKRGQIVAVSGLLDGVVSQRVVIAGLFGPQCLRADENGHLVVATVDDMWLWRVNPLAGTKQPITRITTVNGQPAVAGRWVWLDVDVTGACGPVGDIFLMIAGTSYESLRRIWLDSTGAPKWSWLKGGGPLYSGSAQINQDPWGHYGWAIACSRVYPRMWWGGFASMGLHQGFFRPESPDTWDSATFITGRSLWQQSWEGSPGRPSLALLHGYKGYSLLGCKTAEELYRMPWDEFAAYLRAGAGGTVPRPYTDADLRALRYFCKLCSPYAIQDTKVDPIGHTARNLYPPGAPYFVSVNGDMVGNLITVEGPPRFTWRAAVDQVDTIARYVVRRDGGEAAAEAVVSPDQLAYEDTEVAPGDYLYRIFAENSQTPPLRSVASRPLAVRVLPAQDAEAPAAPTELSAAIDGADVRLAFTPSPSADVDHYEVRREGEPIATLTPSESATVDQTSGRTWTYSVVAVDAAGNASAPAVVTVTVPAPALPPRE